ncbi:MAG: hypothetical protein AMXMBFR84_09250 [Candidatus Hydrogenedentota bacterium]
MSFLVISSSLNPDSRSRVLARAALAALDRHGHHADWMDLRDYALPLCDGSYSYAHPEVADVKQRIAQAQGVVFAVPVYNFSAGSAAKNLVELAGDAWRNQTVAFLCAAGGRSSYMAVMGLANSLMLDFRTLIVPRFVYALETDVENGRVVTPAILERIDEVATQLVRLSRAGKVALEQGGA